MRQFYTITEGDVGKRHLRAFGSTVPLDEVMGYVMPHDVLKRIYKAGGIFQVESNAQRDKRVSDEVTARGGMETWTTAESRAGCRDIVRASKEAEAAQ